MMLGHQFVKPSGQPAAGGNVPPVPLVFGAIDTPAVLADFAKRLEGVEKGMKYAVQGDRVLSQIAICPEAILIQSDKIGLLGEVTFADWYRDVSGQATGQINPSITQIRGGVIRTGQVVSRDGQSWLDLDATGAAAFLKCRSSLSINADGTFSFGAAGGKALTWDGTDLRIGSNSLVSGRTASQLLTDVDGAISAASSALNRPVGDVTKTILENSATSITMTNSQLFKSSNGVGGVFIGAGGIIAKNSSGALTFTLDGSNGSAWFGGDVSTSGQLRSIGNNNWGFTGNFFGGSYAMKSAVLGENQSAGDGSSIVAGVIGRVTDGGTYNQKAALVGLTPPGTGQGYGLLIEAATGGVINANSGKGLVIRTTSNQAALDLQSAGQFTGSAVSVVANAGTFGIYTYGSGVGIYAESTLSSRSPVTCKGAGGSGDALDIQGRMYINNTTVVTNLNADQLDGQHGSFYQNLANMSAGTWGEYEFSTDAGTTWTAIRLRKK